MGSIFRTALLPVNQIKTRLTADIFLACFELGIVVSKNCAKNLVTGNM